MKVVYEADDGKRFDDEGQCFYYDWNLNHPNIKDVQFFDNNGNPISYSWNESCYYNTDRVMVPSKEALADLHAYANLLGFLDYKTIDDIGNWIHNEKSTGFSKSSELEMDLEENERI